jgi:hypothetical protein
MEWRSKKYSPLFSIGTLLFTGLAVFAIACSDSDADDEPASPSGGGGAPNAQVTDLKIEAKEFAFEAPNSIPGGIVKIELKNTGSEPHHAQLARLNDGVTEQQLNAALQNPDPSGALALVALAGGPGIIEPGNDQVTYSDLSPGRYVLLCFVSGDDDVPHLAKGMVKYFDVGQASAQATPPRAAAQVALADFSFLGAETLPTGKSVLEVTNGGPQAHELAIFKLGDNYSVDQFKADMAADAAGTFSGPEPAIEEAGGFQGLAAGKKGWIELDLTPGNYALICFIPDTQTGQPHAYLGMLRGTTVR